MASDLTGGGMYCIIPYPVVSDCKLSCRAKLLYGEIVRLAAARGYCYADNATLLEIMTYEDPKTGALSGITERTLQRLLADLKDRGHICIDKGVVPLKDGSAIVGRRIFVGQKLAWPEDPQGGDKNVASDKNVTPEATKMSSHKRSKKNTSNTPLPPSWIWDAIDNYLFSTGRDGDTEFREALGAFVEYREAIKKPIKAKQTLSAILNKLAKAGQRDIELAMLRKAMEMSWVTIFPLKPDELPVAAKPAAKRFLGTKIVDGVEVDVFG